MIPKHQLVAGVLLCWLAAFGGAAGAQVVCHGDVNGDGMVDTDDALELPAVVFDPADFDVDTLLRADANDDGSVGAADAVAILSMNGLACAPTPTRTITPTRTMTQTPTETPTPPPTPTPTDVCVIHTLSMGTTQGALTVSDCRQQFNDGPRYTDVYSIVGTLGQALKIDVAPGTGSALVPFVSISDANNQFVRVDSVPPIEFVVTTTQPYLISVTSDAMSEVQLGAYSITVSARSCPATRSLNLPTLLAGQLGPASCPDPASPAAGNFLNPVDVYTFNVSAGQVPMSLQILVRQRNYDDDINPIFSVIGPDGYELFDPTLDDDAAPLINDPNYPEQDAAARFLATVPGTYTLIVGGNGGSGLYALSIVSPGSPACAPKPLGTIPAVGQSTVTGQLYGDFSKGCSPPVPIPSPGGDEDVPEPLSGADIYTFTAAAGDVISIDMSSDDAVIDPHLFLYGPASAGNPRIADDDSEPDGSAQIAATLVQPGTYTIVAATNMGLMPPDPSVPGDPGDVGSYSLSVQKCPVAGSLTTGSKTGNFPMTQCVGFGGLPFRTYGYLGSAGDFVSISVSSEDFDPAVRLLGPDGSQLYNDDDGLELAGTSDARVNRILQTSGIYFIEVSASRNNASVDLPAGFTVNVQKCVTTAAPAQGLVNGTFDDSDCQLTSGTKYDVYTFPGLTGSSQRAASIAPPANGCVLGLYAQGLQAPDSGCSQTDLVEMPIITSGTYGFIVAANDPTVRGNYSLQFGTCPMSSITFGGARSGSLSAASCAGADGIASDWYLVRGGTDLVNFVNNQGMQGEVTTGFSGTYTDFLGVNSFSDAFADDSGSMLPLGRDLDLLLKVSGPPFGSYVLTVDPATTRQ